jgi:hypothetical protein
MNKKHPKIFLGAFYLIEWAFIRKFDKNHKKKSFRINELYKELLFLWLIYFVYSILN